MAYLSYCEICEETPSKDKENDFYDFRFDYPICKSCVENTKANPED
jgi:hypothetical protein